MQSIDKSAWPRREIFEFFGNVADPFYMAAFNIDVTGLYNHAKAEGLSFYHSLVYLCTKAVNDIEAYRCGAKAEDEIVLFERRRPSFTHLDKGSELFKIITLPADGSMRDFCRCADEKIRKQECFIDSSSESDDLIYFSCLPWVELTALTNERDTGSNSLDSIPRIAWGKYVNENGRIKLNISIEVNHRFIDGVHIGRFAERLNKLISEL